ncbi:Cullin-domain-containing protein [Delitschia confertaspora ATCC 74209]|uniref:Cullin-domain-containing protein n=1 Tax=Delitschia confertaspora ATCC 74209 TaxID=1513339 RepID=A0A9P4JTT7_9PLEO|nr:Cullin-domain-containing protein [Delitschia confertaspora ATCC 74209]
MSTSSGDRKRKHPTQTISDLFTAQQKPKIATGPTSPTTKRSKLGTDKGEKDSKEKASEEKASEDKASEEKASEDKGSEEKGTPVGVENMYDFPRHNRKGEVVDLTKSPDKTANNNGGIRRPTFNPHSGAKRLVVKNLRARNTFDPQKYLEQEWAKLDKALDQIFKREDYTFSLEELYRGVENLCRQKHAKEVCEKLRKKCGGFLGGVVKVGLKERVGKKNVDVLSDALRQWAIWNDQLKVLHWIFCYMDRAYLLPRQESLHEMVTGLFRSMVFEDTQLNPKIVDGACDLIAADRLGEQFDRDMFSKAIKMFHEMQTYTMYFEPRMLGISQEYIMHWAEKACAEKSLADYVMSSSTLMRKELSRVEMFGLDNTTKRELLAQLEDHLIKRKQERLVNPDDIADLLEDNAVQDLDNLYKLLERRRLGNKLRPAFEKWIEETGTAIVFDEKEQENMVIKLLVLKKQLDAIWKVSFHRNDDLGHGLREAFEKFMNKTKKSSGTWNTDNNKPGEMIAKYVDMLLRGGAKAIPAQLSAISKQSAADEDDNEDAMVDEDSEVNNQLDQVLDLFRFVHGKAVFEAFYKKDLARRLLMGRSASADAERSMLARLKTECGAGFTANLEQMFKDIELGREEMASYRNILEERREKQVIDLSVNVLSASAWPTYPDIPVILPPQIKQAIDRFEAHYKSKHSGRKLDWKHALAHCQVKAKFPKGNKELVVSSFQAIVLLLFNGLEDNEKLSYDYLKQATGLPPAELARTLQSLACAKLRPLTKHPKGRDINPTDAFTINPTFSDPKYRIKINTVQLKETKEENKATHERVAQDRNYETQAAIVRILKARKRISHAELVAETIRVTRDRGTLDVGGIKRNIDRLIEKEFLEREDDGMYSYIA